jgi:hypothetical protein
MVTVIDEFGKTKLTSKTDPDFLSGKLKHISSILKHTEETKRKISEAGKGRKSLLGRKLTDEHKKKISETNKKIPRTKSQLKNLENNTYWLGKTQSKEHIAKMARGHWKPILQFTKNEILLNEWTSIKLAGETLNINKSRISQCCKHKANTAGGYIWKYKE